MGVPAKDKTVTSLVRHLFETVKSDSGRYIQSRLALNAGREKGEPVIGCKRSVSTVDQGKENRKNLNTLNFSVYGV